MPRGATIQDMRAEAFSTPQSPASLETGVAETPQPDYDDTEADESGELRENRRKSFQFVNNFKNVISNIRTIGRSVFVWNIESSCSFQHSRVFYFVFRSANIA
ncbi:hypothetical protein BgiMline_011624 [Biomphalaria glabrata]